MSEDKPTKILMIVRDAGPFQTHQNFLQRRGWDVVVSSSIRSAIENIVSMKPDFVLISVNHPNPKVVKMPTILTQTFNCRTILIGENLDAQTANALNTSGWRDIIHAPVSGPGIQLRLKQILSREKAEEEAQLRQMNSNSSQQASNEGAKNDVNAPQQVGGQNAGSNSGAIPGLEELKKKMSGQEEASQKSGGSSNTMVFKSNDPSKSGQGAYNPQQGGAQVPGGSQQQNSSGPGFAYMPSSSSDQNSGAQGPGAQGQGGGYFPNGQQPGGNNQMPGGAHGHGQSGQAGGPQGFGNNGNAPGNFGQAGNNNGQGSQGGVNAPNGPGSGQQGPNQFGQSDPNAPGGGQQGPNQFGQSDPNAPGGGQQGPNQFGQSGSNVPGGQQGPNQFDQSGVPGSNGDGSSGPQVYGQQADGSSGANQFGQQNGNNGGAPGNFAGQQDPNAPNFNQGNGGQGGPGGFQQDPSQSGSGFYNPDSGEGNGSKDPAHYNPQTGEYTGGTAQGGDEASQRNQMFADLAQNGAPEIGEGGPESEDPNAAGGGSNGEGPDANMGQDGSLGNDQPDRPPEGEGHEQGARADGSESDGDVHANMPQGAQVHGQNQDSDESMGEAIVHKRPSGRRDIHSKKEIPKQRKLDEFEIDNLPTVLRIVKESFESTTECKDDLNVEASEPLHYDGYFINIEGISGFLLYSTTHIENLQSQLVPNVNNKIIDGLKQAGFELNQMNMVDSHLLKELDLSVLDLVDASVLALFSGDTENHVILSYLEIEVPEKGLVEDKDSKMVSFPINIVRPNVQTPFRIYLYLPVNRKYYSYLNKGGVLSQKQLTNLNQKGVKKLHVKEDDREDLERFLMSNNLYKHFKKTS